MKKTEPKMCSWRGEAILSWVLILELYMWSTDGVTEGIEDLGLLTGTCSAGDWNPYSVFSLGLHFVNLRLDHFSLLLRNSSVMFQSRDYNLAPWSPQSCTQLWPNSLSKSDHLSPLWGHLVEQLLTCLESQREPKPQFLLLVSVCYQLPAWKAANSRSS